MIVCRKCGYQNGDSDGFCGSCGGFLEWTGEKVTPKIPEEFVSAAQEEALACDLFLVLGSSLVVYPAAGFPIIAHQNGARLAIVNREPVEHDLIADLALHDEIGPVMSEVVPAN